MKRKTDYPIGSVPMATYKLDDPHIQCRQSDNGTWYIEVPCSPIPENLAVEMSKFVGDPYLDLALMQVAKIKNVEYLSSILK